VNEAIELEYQELLTEVETLGKCLGSHEGIECCKRAWERLTTIDQMLQESHPFPWGVSLNREFDDATIAHLEDAILDIWGFE
jgi:hypothetical protein